MDFNNLDGIIPLDLISRIFDLTEKQLDFLIKIKKKRGLERNFIPKPHIHEC